MKEIDVSKIDFSELVLSELEDEQVYWMARECGKRSRVWARRFAVLLVEVARRGLHKRYGFEGIYEFAAKVGGMGHRTVRDVLAVAGHVRDKPLLWMEFKKGSWSKVKVVAGVANMDTDGFWAGKVRSLTRRALEIFVRGWRQGGGEGEGVGVVAGGAEGEGEGNDEGGTDVKERTNGDLGESGSGLNKLKDEVEPGFGAHISGEMLRLQFRVFRDTEFKFRRFKQKICKQFKRALTFGEVLRVLLKREEELELLVNGSRKRRNGGVSEGDGRYIPQAVKDEMLDRFEGRCAFPGCNMPYEEWNHVGRWAVTGKHERVFPVCKIHHELSHAGCIVNEDKDPSEWRLGEAKQSKDVRLVDEKVRKYKGLE